jgi:hypothetical protein
MILPNKHIKNCESILGLSAILWELIGDKCSILLLWQKFQQVNGSFEFPTTHSFDNFILSIDLLYILGKVEYTGEEIIRIYEIN